MAAQTPADKVTPMMRQYFEVKRKYPDTLVLYRLGDFYEMFFDDAKKASQLLSLTLTHRGTLDGKPVPMAGVPYHSVDSYLSKLIKAGQSAVICEQLGDPSSGRGVMLRKVSRVLTPGTVTDEGIAPERQDNCIACVCRGRTYFGFACLSLSSGQFTTAAAAKAQDLRLLLEKHAPAEVVYPESFKETAILEGFACRKALPDWNFALKTCYQTLCRQFATNSLFGFDIENIEDAVCAAGALLTYVKDTQNVSLKHITSIKREESSDYVILDRVAQKNLELLTNLRGEKRGSLLSILDKTKSPMGSRLLTRCLTEPLRDNAAIEKRLDLTEGLMQLPGQDEVLDLLSSCGDLERAAARLALNTARPKDLLILRGVLTLLPRLKALLQEGSAPLKAFAAGMPELPEQLDLLRRAIAENPSALLRDGGVIAAGYSQELDTLRDLMTGSEETLRAIEERERSATGISSLKVAYNQVHGYYIEISKAAGAKVPLAYQRRQTLKNAERYITPELKELEEKTLSAKARSLELERELFAEIVAALVEHIQKLTALSAKIAELDVLSSFAKQAQERRYVRPQLSSASEIEIKGGRHPVIECLSTKPFIANDVSFKDQRIIVISGPNMGGKSTFMRQTALITIMARIGSFVPAESARIGQIDRIFTRIGASDDLASGRSTFMVEMEETASILNNATAQSLVLMDEVGRGTSTVEGAALARAITQYLCTHIGALTLFSTHYAEITALDAVYPQLKNLCFKAEEAQGRIIFLYKAEHGAQSYSYGVEVGKLAGLPQEVIKAAKGFIKPGTQPAAAKSTDAANAAAKSAAESTENGETEALSAARRQVTALQEELKQERSQAAAAQELKRTLTQLDLNTLTPLQALNTLARLQQEAAAD